MAYCTINDVLAHLSGWIELSESTKPTRAAVESEIEDVSSQVNVALAMGEVALPIDPSETDLLRDLKRLTSREVAFQARALAGTIREKDKVPVWETWHAEFLAAIELMKKGEFTATGLTDDSAPESYTMDAEENLSDTSIQPAITTARKF